MTESVLSKSAKGSAYNIGVTAITILLGFTRSVLLMRLLSPDQFGVVALALFFTTFLSPFSVIGIDSAIIQKKDASKETYSTHFILRLILGIAVLGFGFLAAPILRQFYSPITVNVLIALLGINLLQATYSTPNAIIRREMRFGTMAVLNLAASLSMTITAPLLAYLGAGLWSLVAEQAIGPVVRWVGFWVILRPWKLSFAFNSDEAKSALKFGSRVLSSNTLGILLDRFDDFWTGTTLGATALGFYSRAYEIAQYPERVLATPITNVFYSTYTNLQDDQTELSKAFFRSSSFLIRAGFWIGIVLAITAPEVTLILFGQTWLPIVPIFRLMLIYIILNPLYANLSYLIVGVGHPEILTKVRVMQVLLFGILVITLARIGGTQGVAIAANFMILSGTAALIIQSRKFVRFSMVRMLLWPTVTLIISASAGWLLSTVFPVSNIWISLIYKASSVSIIYILFLYIVERDYLNEYILQILRPVWQRLERILP
jgi:O-antigen/teichoic acid export membrane protein